MKKGYIATLFVIIFCFILTGCSEPAAPVTTEIVDTSSDNKNPAQNGQIPPTAPPTNGQNPVKGPSPGKDPSQQPSPLNPSQVQSDIIGVLKVKENNQIVLFREDSLDESMLAAGEYPVVKMLPSEEHVGVTKYYISDLEYVYIDETYENIVEFIPITDSTPAADEVIGTMIVKEPDIILLFDDASGTSYTVPAGDYNIIKKEETPYPDTFRYFISESEYFYLNDVAEEYVEYVEKDSL